MSYVCDWTVELPVIVGGNVVAYCNDVDCILSLDEDGDLWKVGFRQFRALSNSPIIWVMNKRDPMFIAAAEALQSSRKQIMDLCAIPRRYQLPPPEYERPIYGVTNGRGRIIA